MEPTTNAFNWLAIDEFVYVTACVPGCVILPLSRNGKGNVY